MKDELEEKAKKLLQEKLKKQNENDYDTHIKVSK